jgi:hypothetical protein
MTFTVFTYHTSILYMLFGVADSSLIAIEIGARADGWCTHYMYIVECSPEKSPQREQLPLVLLLLTF